MSNRNLDSIVTSRCVILVRVIDLLTILMKENRIAKFLDDNKAELLKITKLLIFKPQRLDYDYKSKNSLLQLPQRLAGFVTSVYENAPFEFRRAVMNVLKQKLVKHMNALCTNCENLVTEKTISVANINKLPVSTSSAKVSSKSNRSRKYELYFSVMFF
jgi:hypothetical protein